MSSEIIPGARSKAWRGVIERYREFLPVTPETPIITLNEGNTPLVRCARLREAIHPEIDLYLKFEGANPTGSFKDRGMTLAISKAVEAKSSAVICASTGNTSASAAAYGAKAGLKVFVLIPEGNIAMGKLAQAMVHQACVVQIDGNFDKALTLVKEVAEKFSVTLVNSINPYRLQGQKTAAFEICDALGDAPTHHFLPVGNAGNITAYWMGYKEYASTGIIGGLGGEALPRMMGFQAEGAAPIVRGRVIEKPRTVATAIRIGNPASWKQAEAAAMESSGKIDMVSDDEILEAYRMVASMEGIFCEPASAASVAGVIKQVKAGELPAGSRVVCTLTGHGLKDIDIAMKVAVKPVSVKPELNDVVQVLGF